MKIKKRSSALVAPNAEQKKRLRGNHYFFSIPARRGRTERLRLFFMLAKMGVLSNG